MQRLNWYAAKIRGFSKASYLAFQQHILPVKTIKRHRIHEVDPALADIILDTVKHEAESFLDPEWLHGNKQQPVRLEKVLRKSLENYEGDVLEIGCHEGRMTARYASIAQEYGRRVIAVDPWEFGTQNIHGNEYENFLKNTEDYRDTIDIIRASSLDPDTIRRIQNCKIAFAWVDGLHTFSACLQDIITVKHCTGYIAIDDVIWSKECEVATMRGASIINREAVHHMMCREAYLIPG